MGLSRCPVNREETPEGAVLPAYGPLRFPSNAEEGVGGMALWKVAGMPGLEGAEEGGSELWICIGRSCRERGPGV